MPDEGLMKAMLVEGPVEGQHAKAFNIGLGTNTCLTSLLTSSGFQELSIVTSETG